uniref:Uncharacterized protein n=1 Tax=Hemiselmis andersenii TaxID=464988 RepID=A0A6T8KT63_HEMAN|mmetsp:Transcript_24963/g.57869  ORF Transcript_24963/g.57869 Transcript_24963/m.57869 type:complete len:393 (+) Transcript_24963:53-1231(+)|eukprot:CAMPEP_0114125086 /NCGR_PEP_ID=MMETSP0043_2-20121206/9116_1 /TAXON_ID=464988 /ORGANISM="Hemiselmis andersenii, Strain CCMP644" /LENGTH=392 /DNA_ID=CAMNT_0001217995 /DNA_START=62 /DNA_END=1240 /DNA_ORIENTATION=+
MAMDALSLVECQRITATLESAVEKLGILASLTTDFHNEELNSMLGEEISRIIQEQRALEQRYEELIHERRNMKGFANRIKFQANEDEIQRVAHALRQSTKVLTRNLQDNPNLEGNMQKIQGERGALETLLVNTAHELQFASYNSLEEVVDKEEKRMEHMRVVLAREKELSETVARLKQELHEERTAFEQEVLQKNKQITELKERLQEKKTETAIELRYLGKESKAKYNCTHRVWDKEVKDLTDEIALLEDQLAIEQRASTMQSEFLQRKLGAMSERANAMEEKFEKDTADKTKELDALKEEREATLTRLFELEKSYNADVAAREARAEEERRLLELQAIKRAAEERDYRAAVMLQCNYRMHYARQAIDDIKNPKKKGKGKKGKGGGKGKKKK